MRRHAQHLREVVAATGWSYPPRGGPAGPALPYVDDFFASRD